MLLAVELTKKTDVTIITNSAFICRYIRGMSKTKIVLLGGDYQHDSEVLVGPLTVNSLKQFFVDKVFIGVDGFSPKVGFTCVNLMRAEVARNMAMQANHVVVLTDSSKFSSLGVSRQFAPEEVSIVITDTKITDEETKVLENFDIEVRKV